MALFDAIIAGAGPAGIFAAYELKGRNVLVIDVGLRPDPTKHLPQKNINDMRRDGDDVFDSVIGASFESLHNIHSEYMSPKLKSPLMRYITDLPGARDAVVSQTFDAQLSYAAGGLANGWGAGVLRFNDQDLKGFPIRAADLDPFYDCLTDHIGVCGQADDMTPSLGSTDNLLPPLPLSPQCADFLHQYHRFRNRLQRQSISVGRTRAAILSSDHRGRKSYDFLGHDFFQPGIPAIYNPAYTLDEMIRGREVQYLAGKRVLSYRETPRGIEVAVQDLATSAIETIESRVLCLAAGAINTAKIVLESNADRESRLPILDNPISFLPFVNVRRIGRAPDLKAFSGGELVLRYDGPLVPEPVLAGIYGLMSPLRADLFFQMPLSVHGNLAAMKYLVPAMTLLQTFYPDDPDPGNFLQLKADGRLAVQYQPKRRGVLERHFVAAMRPLGFIGSPLLAQYPKPGSSIHYAGCLPMRRDPTKKYETDSGGKLNGTKRVFVVDAANFPRLPSKNLTFTIMANSMRICREIQRSGILAE